MSTALSSAELARSNSRSTEKETRFLTKAKSSVQYLLDPKTGPQPTRFRTRGFLRSFRYVAIFLFWRLVRYAKYAAIGAAAAAVSGTAIATFASGAGFILAPTGILGGAGVGLLWATAKFGWRRAHAKVRTGKHDEHADPRKDEHADAEGLEDPAPIRQPRADPW